MGIHDFKVTRYDKVKLEDRVDLYEVMVCDKCGAVKTELSAVAPTIVLTKKDIKEVINELNIIQNGQSKEKVCV